jgi:hypothetical protein
VQFGTVVRDADVTQLLVELRLAGETPVILLVPGTAKAELSDSALTALGAPRDATLILVQEGNGGSGGATATLAQYADQRYLQPGASAPAGSDGASWQPVADALPTLGLSGDALTVQSGAVESLGDALLTPAPAPPESTAKPAGRGGPGLLLMLLLGALIIAGLAAALMLMRPRPRVAGTRRQEPLPRPVEPARTPRTTPPSKPRPTGATRRATPAPATAPPRRSGRGHPAEVVSVIDPEGYVELEGCLRRVLWGTPGDAPAAPGDRVEVEQHAGRLWAFPAHRSAQPTAGHSASNTNGAAG